MGGSFEAVGIGSCPGIGAFPSLGLSFPGAEAAADSETRSAALRDPDSRSSTLTSSSTGLTALRLSLVPASLG